MQGEPHEKKGEGTLRGNPFAWFGRDRPRNCQAVAGVEKFGQYVDS